MRRKKSDMTNKSVFNYQNFKLTTENFPRWYRAFKRHLTALDLIDCIKKRLIEGCETAYEMIIRLESYFLQVGTFKIISN